MAERSTIFTHQVSNQARAECSSQLSIRSVWKNWLPADAVVMARRSLQVSEQVTEQPTEQLTSTKLAWVPLVIITEAWHTQGAQAKPLLDRMIQAMGLSSEKVIVLEAGEPNLRARVFAFQPKRVVTLGVSSAHSLLGVQFSFKTQRGQWQTTEENLKVMPTLDLQTLLNNPATKKEAWADLQKVMKALVE